MINKGQIMGFAIIKVTIAASDDVSLFPKVSLLTHGQTCGKTTYVEIGPRAFRFIA